MKILFTICGIILLVMILSSACKTSDKSNDADLLKIIKEGAFLVDVRTLEEFEAGHVEGSVNIPLNTIESNLNKFKDKKHIVVFCRSGKRSANAKVILEKNGFTNVLNGGAWTSVEKLIDKINDKNK